MVIIATSDQHLGYPNSDKPAFNAFLDKLQNCKENVTDFVLLGDVVDMWRRDASGVFLENMDIFDKIACLQKKMHVHYVAGNHDFHVTHLKDHSYPFDFKTCLQLPGDGLNCRFVHGYQFDIEQSELISEGLCRMMSDTVGKFESDVWTSGVWATLASEGSDFHYSKSTLSAKTNFRKKVERLQLRPEERLTENLDAVTREACSKVKSGEILVFGHTHNPYINKSGTVVNTGSWVTDSPLHNTYVKLDAGGPKIFVFGGDEITERVRG
jgi:UDP-2,3-diacylglucosamine pyrophosphatase LpxH